MGWETGESADYELGPVVSLSTARSSLHHLPAICWHTERKPYTPGRISGKEPVPTQSVLTSVTSVFIALFLAISRPRSFPSTLTSRIPQATTLNRKLVDGRTAPAAKQVYKVSGSIMVFSLRFLSECFNRQRLTRLSGRIDSWNINL